MRRVCFVLQVKKERLHEYKERHRSVWPEMIDALRKTGWNNYSLFLRSDGLLVGYLETEDFARARAAWRIWRSTPGGKKRWRTFLSSPKVCFQTRPCNRSKKCFTFEGPLRRL